MTPLRQRMTEDMQLRGLAPATQQVYLRYVEQLAVFTGKSPDLVTEEEFCQFFFPLPTQRGWCPLPAPISPAPRPALTRHPQCRRSLAHSRPPRAVDLLHLPRHHLYLWPTHQR